ncbi:MAG TPA: Tim44/TimA family putative adaptor protein [Paracoccus sp. (in: a-proteobacteria)]|uniref:Tim44/TimA family putative adaptor protein n=1 Tax=uncultured Paracoccus sp. TaxID=189685 RepID=UPI00260A747A|nr:Tim44/TimA family putative adaptor protein [uncultured Paracoccus sp.]HMQ40382.1 Tim44/TimA family putative adaptor protein [Paracoccus sp. (in: a-proteobacteria)]HMR34997.1 Tim44/TimA family putative adaptor protein [Paracoccus sp. (in: a-proteobacteria)]
MSNSLIQLIVLAAIAVFLILRLRNVLGTRDGFEPDQPDERPVQRRLEVVEDDDPRADDSDLSDHVDPASPAYAALVEMKRAEPAFSLTEFLGGAKQAYEMIIVAFEKGDLAEIRAFLSPEVAQAFESAIEARQNAGLTPEVQFLGTRETALAAAEFNTANAVAELSVRFVGEIIVATRDAAGNVVDGDPKTPRKQRDTWTFEREMGAADPNWRLVATGN